MMKAEYLCNHIVHLVHAPIYVYNEQKEQITVYIDNGEQQCLYDCDPQFLEFLLGQGREEPLLYVEERSIIYGIIKTGGDTYILGPCALERDEVAAAGYLVRRHRMDCHMPYCVHGVPMSVFSEMMIMLYEMFTGETMGQSELFLNSFCDDSFRMAMEEKLHMVFQELHGSGTIHNPHSQELREQGAIRAGNLEALKESFRENYVGKLGVLSKDPLRNEKNLAIAVIALACRSAIEGGLMPEVAYSMSDAFIQRLEELNEIGKVQTLMRKAEIDYCNSVRKLASSGSQNALVKRCKNLVYQQIHARVTSKELAEQLEVSPSYLSRLFVREEGMKLTDYISHVKIESAKKKLSYTQDTYEEIAYSLGFATQSHFGQVFKKYTGMSPGQYKKLYRN